MVVVLNWFGVWLFGWVFLFWFVLGLFDLGFWIGLGVGLLGLLLGFCFGFCLLVLFCLVILVNGVCSLVFKFAGCWFGVEFGWVGDWVLGLGLLWYGIGFALSF